jgi:opacity protein-like surface antigen
MGCAPHKKTIIHKFNGGNFMWKKTLLLMGLITLIATQVNAQSFSFGPQVGYYKASDADKGAFMGGVAWRLKLMPALGVEASINYRQEKYGDDALTVRSWPIMLTGLIYPLPYVYGAIGAGWYSVTFDYDQDKLPFLEDKTTQKVGWHFGGGVELPVGPKFKLTGDIRYVFLNYDFQEIPGRGDLKSNFYVIMVGLQYVM